MAKPTPIRTLYVLLHPKVRKETAVKYMYRALEIYEASVCKDDAMHVVLDMPETRGYTGIDAIYSLCVAKKITIMAVQHMETGPLQPWEQRNNQGLLPWGVAPPTDKERRDRHEELLGGLWRRYPPTFMLIATTEGECRTNDFAHAYFRWRKSVPGAHCKRIGFLYLRPSFMADDALKGSKEKKKKARLGRVLNLRRNPKLQPTLAAVFSGKVDFTKLPASP